MTKGESPMNTAAEIMEQQEPLAGLEAARIKFTGMSLDEVTAPPNIDDRQSFIVEAICTGRGVQRMKDGELRRTATMTVIDVAAQGGPFKPEGAPNLFSVNDETDD
jgi:hypothetical protein